MILATKSNNDFESAVARRSLFNILELLGTNLITPLLCKQIDSLIHQTSMCETLLYDF